MYSNILFIVDAMDIGCGLPFHHHSLLLFSATINYIYSPIVQSWVGWASVAEVNMEISKNIGTPFMVFSVTCVIMSLTLI